MIVLAVWSTWLKRLGTIVCFQSDFIWSSQPDLVFIKNRQGVLSFGGSRAECYIQPTLVCLLVNCLWSTSSLQDLNMTHVCITTCIAITYCHYTITTIFSHIQAVVIFIYVLSAERFFFFFGTNSHAHVAWPVIYLVHGSCVMYLQSLKGCTASLSWHGNMYKAACVT